RNLIETIKIAKKLSLDEIFHLGDHFTNRSSQKLKTLLGFRSICRILTKEGIVMRTIPGNHDKTDQNVSASYLDIFARNNFVVYNGKEPEYHEVGDVRFYFLPFFTESVYLSKLQEIVDSLSKK